MDSFEYLKSKGVLFSQGLSDETLSKIESIYQIKFPLSLKRLFLKGIPISDGFYRWDDFSASNIDYIKKMLNYPLQYISENIHDIDWLDDRVFSDEKEKMNFAEEALAKAPRLIPLYLHRYVPMIEANDPPILSVHGFDVIVYGKNLQDWIRHEFDRYHRKYSEKEVFIPFWTEIC